jgi:hypothetical protein
MILIKDNLDYSGLGDNMLISAPNSAVAAQYLDRWYIYMHGLNYALNVMKSANYVIGILYETAGNTRADLVGEIVDLMMMYKGLNVKIYAKPIGKNTHDIAHCTKDLAYYKVDGFWFDEAIIYKRITLEEYINRFNFLPHFIESNIPICSNELLLGYIIKPAEMTLKEYATILGGSNGYY